ncbi:MAG: hypothetical protein ACYC5V_03340 [Gemmatimonadaceae bacterium]
MPAAIRGALEAAGFSVRDPACRQLLRPELCVAASALVVKFDATGGSPALRLELFSIETSERFADVSSPVALRTDSTALDALTRRLLQVAESSPARPWAPVAPSRFTRADLAGCYEFDTQHFRVFSYDRAFRTMHTMQSTIIRLYPEEQPSRWARGRMRAEIVTGWGGDSVFARYRDFSGWYFLRGDSIRVQWRDGFSGPDLRLAVTESTLVGMVMQTSDAIDARNPPRWLPTRAKRITCPSRP